MRYFVTGGTGFVGSRVVRGLLDDGHEVLGLARSQTSAELLRSVGATAVLGDLTALDVLRRAARSSDGVVHTAFPNADLRGFRRNAALERTALEAMGEALRSTGAPLVAAGGFAPVRATGPLALESDPARSTGGVARRNVEATVLQLAAQGTCATVVRLPCVHGDGDRFTLHALIERSRRTGASWVVGDGSNRLPAVHVDDAARLFCRAVTRPMPGARLHAVADEGVPHREVAEVIARHLDVPVRSTHRVGALRHLGSFGGYIALDQPASSVWTREVTGWAPTGPSLLDDLDRPGYFTV